MGGEVKCVCMCGNHNWMDLIRCMAFEWYVLCYFVNIVGIYSDVV